VKENNYQPTTLHPARLSFRIQGEIISFQNKQKIWKFMTITLALQKMIKGALNPEVKKKSLTL
jgi:hypothetical protein